MRYHTYGETPTRAEIRAVVLAGDNRSAPGTRNYATSQPLSASETIESISDYNVESTKDRKAADKMWDRPPAIMPSGPMMGSGPRRAPPTGAKETRSPSPEKYNQSRARMVAKFTAAGYDRFKGPTLESIYAALPARTIENRIAYAPEAGPSSSNVSSAFEMALARAEKLLKLAADAVERFGADYQPLLDEAQDILDIIAGARLSGAEIPPSVSTRLDVLEKGISGQLGERVGLTRGISPAELRTTVTDIVTTVAGPLGPQVAAIATIVADLAASIPGVTADLIAAAAAAIAEAAEAGGVSAAISAAGGAISALTPASGRSAVNDALRKLSSAGAKEAKNAYDAEKSDIEKKYLAGKYAEGTIYSDIKKAIKKAKAEGPAAIALLPPAWQVVAAGNPDASNVIQPLVLAEKNVKLDKAKKKFDETLADIANTVAVLRASVPAGAPAGAPAAAPVPPV